MRVVIRETGANEELRYVDPKSPDINHARDIIGNEGGFDQFEYDSEKDVYYASEETFRWWERTLAAHQEVDERIYELCNEFGADAVEEVLRTVGNYDFEDLPAAIHAALDEAFGR